MERKHEKDRLLEYIRYNDTWLETTDEDIADAYQWYLLILTSYLTPLDRQEYTPCLLYTSKELPGPPVDPSQDPKNMVRVRHYSPAIGQIRIDMRIKPSTQNSFALWVEYPITTPYEERAIQKTTESFFRPLSGRGGCVEFNVDLRKWRMDQDPNLPNVSNAKIIYLYSDVIGTDYVGVGFPLTEPNVCLLYTSRCV